jgi:hypothetical protein
VVDIRVIGDLEHELGAVGIGHVGIVLGDRVADDAKVAVGRVVAVVDVEATTVGVVGREGEAQQALLQEVGLGVDVEERLLKELAVGIDDADGAGALDDEESARAIGGDVDGVGEVNNIKKYIIIELQI